MRSFWVVLARQHMQMAVSPSSIMLQIRSGDGEGGVCAPSLPTVPPHDNYDYPLHNNGGVLKQQAGQRVKSPAFKCQSRMQASAHIFHDPIARNRHDMGGINKIPLTTHLGNLVPCGKSGIWGLGSCLSTKFFSTV